MIEYLNRETVMKELDRNSITKKITLSDGVSIYDSIQKLPTADVVEVDKVAEMFTEQFGDKCPCNFNDNDEWLTLYCDYTNTGDCPCKDGWKQFVKHYDKRKEQEE